MDILYFIVSLSRFMDCCPGEGLSAITSCLKDRDPLMQEILNNTEWNSKHAV